MTPYLFSTRLLAPLLVQKTRRTHAPETLEYLPGSTLRGALAGMYLRGVGAADDPDFRLLFGPGGPAFPDLLPTTGPDVLSESLPLTTISCKRFPGFLPKNGQGGGHGVRDSLVVLAANRMQRAEGENVDPKFWRCPRCGNDAKPFGGVWNNHPHHPETVRPTMVLHRHTGIDRTTGTVADGVFYAPQVLREAGKPGHPQYLTGRVFLNPEQHAALTGLIRERTVFAGGDRARGLGELSLELSELPPCEVDAAAWSAAWSERYLKVVGEAPPAGTYFSIRLASPAVLVDRFLRPAANLDLHLPGVELVGRNVQRTVIRGWQAAWGLPKADDPALERGSVFLYRSNGEDVAGLNRALTRLNIAGVGLRRQEGLGDVRVCEPVHVQEEI